MALDSHISHANNCGQCEQLEIAAYLQTIPLSNPLISHLFEDGVFKRTSYENANYSGVQEVRDLMGRSLIWGGLQEDMADIALNYGLTPTRIASFYDTIGTQKWLKLSGYRITELMGDYDFGEEAFNHPDQTDISLISKAIRFSHLIADYLVVEIGFEDAFRFFEKVLDNSHLSKEIKYEDGEADRGPLLFSSLMESMIDYRSFLNTSV